MFLPIISVAIYIANIILSILISLTIINKLYISKKFSKENDFHFYNDMFSWEMFFFQIGIANVLTIISMLLTMSTYFFNLFFKIRIFLYFMAFWNKIIHLEKIMDKITYERHYFAGIIPCIFVLLIILIDLPILILLFIFIAGSIIPYLILEFLFKKTSTYKKKIKMIFIGVVFIILGCVFSPELLINYSDANELFDLINIIAPIFFLIGTFFIFESFRRQLL